MKPDVANSQVVVQKVDAVSTRLGQASSCTSKGYASRLRALGQALEKFSFLAFDVTIRGGTYLVVAKAHPSERAHDSLMEFVSESFRQTSFRSDKMTSGPQIVLRFSAAEIEQFDRYGQSRRRNAGKTPDPCSISQLLRSAGCFLDDQNEVKQVKISLLGKWVTVRYQSLQGNANQIKHDLNCFYDYWIQMFGRRGSRIEIGFPTQSTLLITGQGIPHTSLERPLRIKHHGTQSGKNKLA